MVQSKMRKHLLPFALVAALVGCGNSSSTGTGNDIDAEICGADCTCSVDAGSPACLSDVEAGRIFQRDTAGRHDLSIQGTADAGSSGIEARVITHDTQEEVVPWTVIDDSPSDGTFSGTLANVPQGGWYSIEVRAHDDPSFVHRGSNEFGVGILIVVAGQSHVDLWFEAFLLYPEAWEEYGEAPTNDLTRMYRHAQVLQQGPAWTGWQPVTGVGAKIFANTVQEALGIPVALLDYAVGGSALWQANADDPADLGLVGLIGDFGWWLADESNRLPHANNYAVLKAGLDSIDNRVEALLWVQGDTDAGSGESAERYQEGLEQLISTIRSDTGVADLPVFVSLLPRQGTLDLSLGDLMLTIPPNSDEDRQNIRDAQERYSDGDPNAYLACTAIDLPLLDDNVHHTPEGQELQARRMAQSMLRVILNSGEFTYHRGPRMTGYSVVDSSTIEVDLRHEGGSDFTPASNIAGFEVMVGEQAVVPVIAERFDSDTIRLTVEEDTSSVTGIRYLHGVNPGDLDLSAYADRYVHDNTALELPLEGGLLP